VLFQAMQVIARNILDEISEDLGDVSVNLPYNAYLTRRYIAAESNVV
jgi:hypothetical protein